MKKKLHNLKTTLRNTLRIQVEIHSTLPIPIQEYNLYIIFHYVGAHAIQM